MSNTEDEQNREKRVIFNPGEEEASESNASYTMRPELKLTERRQGTSNLRNDIQVILDNFENIQPNALLEVSETSIHKQNKKITFSKMPSKEFNENMHCSTESSNEGQRSELIPQGYECFDDFSNDQTLTEVESLPQHFVTNGNGLKHAKRKPKSKSMLIRKSRSKSPKHNVQPRQVGSSCLRRSHCCNRYNYNHLHVRERPEQERKFSLCDKILGKKKKYKHKNMSQFGRPFSNSDSGETVPQLYQAKMKRKLCIPEKFTFKAVTGSICPSFVKQSNVDLGTPHPSGFHEGQESNCKCKMKNASNGRKLSENFNLGNNGEPEEKKDILPLGPNDFTNLRACLNFDGTEYISTSELPKRIDIYCFDHLNTSYFRTTDQPPPLMTDEAIQKTEELATRFWAEIFGFIHLFFAFVTAFILQLYKFLLFSLIRPLVSGIVQLTSDYFIKPLLTITYNGFTQPFMVFIFNVATSFRDICYPIARGIGYFLTEIAVLLRAIRLIECNRPSRYPTMKDFNC